MSVTQTHVYAHTKDFVPRSQSLETWFLIALLTNYYKAATKGQFRGCLVPSQNTKFFKIPRHIEYENACMKH